MWYNTRNIIYKRHNKTLDCIKSVKDSSLDIINEVLCFNSLVIQEHFNFCTSIIEKAITVDLPVPRTNKINVFSKIVVPLCPCAPSVENLESLRKSGKYVYDCYRIWALENPNDMCYIGQVKHLGIRVKYQAKGKNKSTREFCLNRKNTIKIDLYIISDIGKIPGGLSLTEFLCV